LTESGQTVVKEDVTIIGPANLASTMPDHASSLYSRNVQSLLELMVKDGELALDFEDEIIKGACITRDGEIVHEGAKQAAGPAQPDRSSGAGGGASISGRGAGGSAEVS
jgi:NAD(P) transhydrogenase subunit alpha